MIPHVVFGVLTLYMLLILLRWFGPWLELNTDAGRWAWIGRLTEPLIQRIRRVLPHLGPMDFAPLATLLLVWVIRNLAVRMLWARM
jgi:YggT family protein